MQTARPRIGLFANIFLAVWAGDSNHIPEYAFMQPALEVTSYAKDIWFVMHHSDDPTRKTLALTCYCDDSGSHEEAENAVVGGTLMTKPFFEKFDREWSKMLKEFRLEYIHMTDFVRPQGRYITMQHEMKIALFKTITTAITKNRVWSISLSVPQSEFKRLLTMDIYRKLIGPYAMAFMAVIHHNVLLSKAINYRERIAYLASQGSKHHSEQLIGAHSTIIEWEKRHSTESHTGSITFEEYKRNSALQAADVIAWTHHRKLSPDGITNEYLPLLGIFDTQLSPSGKKTAPHSFIDVGSEGVEILASGINRWISSAGEMPGNLFDLMTPSKVFKANKKPASNGG